MNTFIAQLKDQLNQADWPIVVAALRSEAALWDKLQDNDFGQRALARAEGQPARFSPGFLGLLSLEQEQHFDILRASPLNAVDEKLRYQAASAFEELATKGDETEKSAPELEQATYLALALRERFRLADSWEQLQDDLSLAPSSYWRMSLACLFGMIPQPEALLAELLSPGKPAHLNDLGIHALLSNPLSSEEQYSLVKDSVADFSVEHWLPLLRKIASQRPSLAAMLANDLLAKIPSDNGEGAEINQLASLLQQSEIHQISGRHSEALPLLSAAWEASQRVQASLAAKLAESAAQNEDRVTALAALEQATLLDPEDEKLKTELLARQLENGHVQAGQVGLDSKQHPGALIAAARVAARNGDFVEAQSMAQTALEIVTQGQTISGQNRLEVLHKLAQLLLEIDLPVIARQAAEFAMQSNPENAQSVHLLSQADQAIGDYESALESAHLAVALDPQELELRRFLAKSLHTAESYDAAYTEWERLVQQQDEPQLEDLFSLAESAFQSGRFQRCAELCLALIDKDTEDAKVYSLLGRALLAEENEEGIGRLKRATELDPGLVEAWLALAEYQQNHAASDQALQTLQSASKHIAESAEIHAALGINYLEQGSNEVALTALRQANDLVVRQASHSDLAQNIALHLGQLEINLGLVTEARNTLSQAHMAFPGNADIGHAYGRVLLNLKQYAEALSAFTAARQADPHNLDLQLDTAQAHLQADLQLAQGLALLENVLAQQPKNINAEILYAEIQLAVGQIDEGRIKFESLLKSAGSLDSQTQKRLSLGLASAEAKGGNLSGAIVQLEALQKDQLADLDVLRALCAAYCDAGREEEAFQIANQVYLSSEQDEQPLLWFVEMAQHAGKSKEAEQALSKAIQESQQPQALLIHLGKLQWHAGNKSSARANFSSLLKISDLKNNHLLDVAQFFRTQGEAKQAVSYLQKAIDNSAEADASLFDTLSDVLHEANQAAKALKAIEEAIQIAPNNPSYLVKKSELLQQLNRPQAALQSLDEALQLLPEDAELLESKARLLFANQDWASALNYAEKAAAQNRNNANFVLFAAELAAACLQTDRARALINQSAASAKNLELASLNAELALESGESVSAAQAIAPILETAEEHPRVLALRARLALSGKDYAQADKLFKKTLKALGMLKTQEQNSSSFLATLFGVALASQEMNNWETAIKLFKQVADKSPTQARAQFALAKALTQRAEWQQLCQASKAIRHAPGEVALSKASHRASLQALKVAHYTAPFTSSQAEIALWKTRADLRFDPKSAAQNLPEAYPQNAAEAAALVFAAQETEDRSNIEKKSEAYGKSPEVLIELAIAYASRDAVLAMQWARKATQLSRQQTPYYIILAQIAWEAGDIDVAFKAAEKALALWPKEPRWHALLANWQQAQDEMQLAIEHLEEAVNLDPEYAPANFELGMANIDRGSIDKAVAVLDKAHQLEPRNANYLLELARAQQQFGDLKAASQSAKRAYKLDSQNNSALILRAELALEGNQVKKAASLIEQVLEQKPEDLAALKVLAETKLAQGQAEEAINILEQVQKKAADPVPLQIRRAQILSKSRGEGSDLKALQRLSERLPKRADVAVALSEVLALAGDLEQATQVAQRAMRHAKQLSTLEQARLHLHLGQLLKHDGQLDQALHHLDEAAGVAKHLAEIHIERGQVFLARRQHDQAMQAFEQASLAAPKDAQPHFQAALALKEAKDYAAAEKGLRRAAELAPSNRSIQRQLAALIALNLVHQPG